jgi:hypothetical protein
VLCQFENGAPTVNEKDDDISAEYLHHALMNETRDYLARGRRLAASSDQEVQNVWVAAFERWFEQKTAENVRNMDDAAAELRLRNLEPPYDRVKAKTEELQAAIQRLGPNAPSASLDQTIDEFLVARSKPKN